LYWDVEVTPEDEDKIIRKIAEKIHQYGLDIPAVLMIETIKPLSFIGTRWGVSSSPPSFLSWARTSG
jgi:hypothetical protein